MQTKHPVTSGRGLLHFLLEKPQLPLKTRTARFHEFLGALKEQQHYSYQRKLLSATGPRVIIEDPYTGQEREMRLFASNNYLGLATHPHVIRSVQQAAKKYGVGMGGPPLLNGYSSLMQAVEEQLADFKGQEAAAIFPAGFMTNLGAIGALSQKNDLVIHDQLSHASLHDALALAGARSVRFAHNNMQQLEKLLQEKSSEFVNRYVAVEGVYSMDGDVAPLDQVVALCQKYDAFSIVDDAHGTGVLGPNGEGTTAHFELEKEVDLITGTFSKTFAVTGGFLAGDKDLIEYIRYFARPYIFSAALPPTTLAAVKAGLEVIRAEPERRQHLWKLITYAQRKLRRFGLTRTSQAAILPLRIPKGMIIREANRRLHQMGIFLNAIEYPAVAQNKQRFRVSLTADHSLADIDFLAECLENVWQDPFCYEEEPVLMAV